MKSTIRRLKINHPMANLQEPRQIAGFANAPGRWKPYPAYKPSGVDWLGAIPAHWEVKRLKYVAPICDERAYAVEPEARYIGLEHIESATGRLAESASDGSQNGAATEGTAAVFRTGDVLFGKLRPYLSKVFEAGFDGVCSTELLVMRPTPEITPRFLAYTLLSKGFITWVDSMTYGTKMPRASPEQVTNTEAPLPPVTEQRAIVAFLDRETAKIDALVAKRERLIELLQEKRAALITHAVTKGLNPSAPMKPSGVEWVGRIPTHWEVKRLKFVATLQRGYDLPEEDREPGEVPVVSSAGISDRHAKAMVRGPGVVTGRYGSVGGVFFISEDFWPLNTALYVKRFWDNQPKYIQYLLTILPIEAHAAKSAVPGVDRKDLHEIPCPVPAGSEQGAICDFLECETGKMDRLIGRVREHIQKLGEYRGAVISAAVTGKIDVRQETG